MVLLARERTIVLGEGVEEDDHMAPRWQVRREHVSSTSLNYALPLPLAPLLAILLQDTHFRQYPPPRPVLAFIFAAYRSNHLVCQDSAAAVASTTIPYVRVISGCTSPYHQHHTINSLKGRFRGVFPKTRHR